MFLLDSIIYYRDRVCPFGPGRASFLRGRYLHFFMVQKILSHDCDEFSYGRLLRQRITGDLIEQMWISLPYSSDDGADIPFDRTDGGVIFPGHVRIKLFGHGQQILAVLQRKDDGVDYIVEANLPRRGAKP